MYLTVLDHNNEPEVFGFITRTEGLEGVRDKSNLGTALRTDNDLCKRVEKTWKESKGIESQGHHPLLNRIYDLRTKQRSMFLTVALWTSSVAKLHLGMLRAILGAL